MVLIKYLVEFTPHCVSDFERKHYSRITSEIVNSLLIIGDCTMNHCDRKEIQDLFQIDVACDEFENPGNSRQSWPVLVINQMARFEMDQVELCDTFPFCYRTL